MSSTISDWTALPIVTFDLGILAMLVLSAAYGGVHLTAWTAFFCSEVERVLWRSSAILIAGGVALHVCFAQCTFSVDTDRGLTYARLVVVALSIIAWLVLAALYAFARVFLVVESFIQLRSVPIGVYAAVSTLVSARMQLRLLTISRFPGPTTSHTFDASI